MSRFNVMPRATQSNDPDERLREQISSAYRVPYWIMSDRPRPSWFKRPIWRARAIWWRYSE